MLLLLLGCQRLSPPPEPLALSVALPAARHARGLAVRGLLWPQAPERPLTSEEATAFCAWEDGEAEDDRLPERLMRDGRIGFALLEVDVDRIRLSGVPIVPLSGGLIPPQAQRELSETTRWAAASSFRSPAAHGPMW